VSLQRQFGLEVDGLAQAMLVVGRIAGAAPTGRDYQFARGRLVSKMQPPFTAVHIGHWFSVRTKKTARHDGRPPVAVRRSELDLKISNCEQLSVLACIRRLSVNGVVLALVHIGLFAKNGFVHEFSNESTEVVAFPQVFASAPGGSWSERAQ